MSLRAKQWSWLSLPVSLVFGLALAILATGSALAQTSLGTLAGIVRDSSDAVIIGATVKVTNEGTSEQRETKTSALGAYRFDALPPGSYTVQVTSAGFEGKSAKGVVVSPSVVLSYDVQLKPGAVSEMVTVEADVVVLNQENGSLSETLGSQNLAQLPIFSLNPIELAVTVPGVQRVSSSGYGNGFKIQVSGARSRANNFMIDGQEINDAGIAGQALQPSIPDMFSDMTIFTHNAPAEFGRATGGVVNMITKGGTNQFHGSGWELYQGSGLDAKDGQLRLAKTTPKTRYNQHQYGFTAGGPVLKDKLFLFGASQWTRYYGKATATKVRLPNASGVALLKTLAAGSGTTATNAALLLKYLGNATYLTSFTDFGSASNQALGAACPTAGCTLGINYFLRPDAPQLAPGTQWNIRGDYTPRKQDIITARYVRDSSSFSPDFSNNGTALPGFETDQGGTSELAQIAWTHTVSPSLVNEFRAGLARLGFFFRATEAAKANPLFSAYNLAMTDLTTLGFNQNFPQGRSQNMYQFQDTISWTIGRHTIRAGADIGRRLEKDLVSQNANGQLSFVKGGTGTSAEGNFLLNQLGTSGAATITYGNTRFDPHSWRSGVFAQDDIKITPELVANVGVRYDYFTNPENSLKYPAIDPDNPYTAVDSVYKVNTNAMNFAPRVGLAYAPRADWMGNGKTVIRAGFGIFYDSDFTNIAINEVQSSPNAVAGTLTSSVTGGLTNATGLIATIPKVLNAQSSVTSVVKNLASPYAAEWNLGIERELPWQSTLSATYVANRGIKLYANQQYNYGNSATGLRLNTTRGAIAARGNYADSNYQGLEIAFKHKFTKGIDLRAAYIYGKTLDNGSEVFNVSSSPTSYTADLSLGGRRRDWGNSAYDHRQYFSLTYVWAPTGFHANSSKVADGLLGALTRNWTISGVTTLQSGAYMTAAISGLDMNRDLSTANDRPVLSNPTAAMSAVGIDGSWVGGTTGVYYDMAANNATGALNVVQATAVRWLVPSRANYDLNKIIGRNSYLTPGIAQNDIALEKAVPTKWTHLERARFVVRAEAKNFANHNNVNYPYMVGSNATNVLYAGTNSYLNPSLARESINSRSVRIWAKFTF